MFNRIFTTSVLAVAVSVVSVGVDRAITSLDLVPQAVAQEKKKDQRETRRTPALRNKVYEKLAEAQTFAEAKQYKEAEVILNEMISTEGKKALNSYELANVYNLFAFLRYSTEDYKGALDNYRKVVAQPDIPLAMEINTKKTIAQLFFVQEQWQQGVDALLEWFDLSEKPDAGSYVLLSQGYYQLKDYDKALKNVAIAIDMYEVAGKLPKEQWYNLARFLYFDKGDTDNALATLNVLLKYTPKSNTGCRPRIFMARRKTTLSS